MMYTLVRSALWTIAHLLFRIRLEGLENVPSSGGALLISNHISYADSVLAGITTTRRARYLMFRFAIRYPGRLGKELLWEQMASGVPCPGFADALDAVIEYDARDRLEEIKIPTMIVWGTDDWVIPSAAALSYNRRIPHSRLEIFEHTGHVPQLERPERFNRILENFLEVDSA